MRIRKDRRIESDRFITERDRPDKGGATMMPTDAKLIKNPVTEIF